MGVFERYLSLWVFICIVIGVSLGHLFPSVFHFFGELQIAHINIPVAVLVWLMIIPMLVKVDLKALKDVHKFWRGISVTLFVNWGVKPFSMALLGWIFIGYFFRDWLPVTLIAVRVVGSTAGWYESKPGIATYEECCPVQTNNVST